MPVTLAAGQNCWHRERRNHQCAFGIRVGALDSL